MLIRRCKKDLMEPESNAKRIPESVISLKNGAVKWTIYTKNAERELTPVRAFREEKQINSRYFNGSYRSTSSIKSNSKTDKCQSDRPSPSLDRYRGCSSRETSREPESISSRHGLNSQSESCRGHSVDKMVTEQNSASSRGMNGASTIRNPSPDLRARSPAQRMCSKISTLKRRSESPNYNNVSSQKYVINGISDPSPPVATSSQSNGLTTNNRRFTPSEENPDKLTTDIGHTESNNFQIQSQQSKTSENIDTSEPSIRIQYSKGSIQRSELKSQGQEDVQNASNGTIENGNHAENDGEEMIVISVVTRGTSPTPPPPLTAFTRTRRLEPIPKPVQREVKKSWFNRIIRRDQILQVDRSDDSFRDRCTSRYSSGTRTSSIPWVSSYLDRYSAPVSTPNRTSATPQRPNSTPSQRDNNNHVHTVPIESPRCTTETFSRSIPIPTMNGGSSNGYKFSASLPSISKVQHPPSTKSNLKSPSDDGSVSEVSYDASLPSAECQDHGQGSTLRRDSLSKSSESSTTTSSSSSQHCKPAASMTKIKSAGTATTSSNSSVASNISGDGKCASNGNSNSAESSVRSHRASSPDARERKPPVPKSEVATAAKNAATMAAGSAGIRYVNKDFRKSALNMENGDPSRSQITERKLQKKSQRSLSVSSQDSEANSEVAPQVLSSGSSASVRSNKSGSKPGSKSSASGRSKTNQRNSVKEGSKSLRLGTPKAKSIFKNGSVSTSNCSSSEGSNSEGENDGGKQQSKAKSRRRRSSDSPYQDGGKGKMSRGSSRTSVLGSSADELSINTEKPPRPPSSPRIRSERSANTEEAKSFLMRALGPVTNFFKVKQDDDEGNNGGWIDADSEGNSETVDQVRSAEEQSVLVNHNCNSSRKSPSERKKQLSTKLRHQSSEEKPWWLDPNSDNVPEGVDRNPSVGNDDISQDTTVSSAVLPDDGKFKFKVWRGDSEERAWWLDANDNIPNGETAITTAEPTSTKSCNQLPPASPSSAASLSRKGSYSSASAATTRSNKQQQRRLRHQSSGERAWWMSDDPDSIPDGIEVIAVSDEIRKPPLRHVDSGERPWWLDSSAKVPDGVERLPTPEKIQIGGGSSGTSDSSESFERVEIGRAGRRDGSLGLARFPLEVEALGDRASPEGIENPPRPPDDYDGRSSPYDNVSTASRTPPKRSAPRKRPANLPLFISTHTNIDDLLGDITGPSHSPHMMRNHQGRDDESDEDEECREIDATQVIIHDSTPQTPVIQRRIRDNDRPQPDGYIPSLEELTVSATIKIKLGTAVLFFQELE
ncbi:hypothetical protein QAD02_004333 [Eretmocerus hayati]|uniref:Uncharacterized protein n=1 Tax=Eretmocerus hayati TaxID=131215 RepID=A0ACC2NPM6_9HYME|nr:hypothetical protein QAD02_004333 [Eretmocerus hayati]